MNKMKCDYRSGRMRINMNEKYNSGLMKSMTYGVKYRMKYANVLKFVSIVVISN